MKRVKKMVAMATVMTMVFNAVIMRGWMKVIFGLQ